MTGKAGPVRILYLTQYFPPEVGATQTRAHEMARYLVGRGHHVTIVTEVPNHPSGIIPPAYRKKLYTRDKMDGIDVIRVWVKASPQKSFAKRMTFYLSYMVNAALAGIGLARGRYDAIFATSPPLFVGAAGLVLSYLRRIPFVFEVRDLWPESAVALGELTHPRAIALASQLEKMCYNRARRIVVVTRGIEQRLKERGLGEKVVLIPNGANTDLFRPVPEAGSALRAKLGLDDKFLVLYAGIHGLAQGLDSVLYAAQQLQDTPEVHFLFVGEGPKKAELRDLQDRLSLTNVTMLPERPRHEMPAFLSAAHVALVPLRKLALFEGAVPSKLFDSWACGCPVLLSIDGEARRVLEQADGGVYVESENPAQMAQALARLEKDRTWLRTAGEKARAFVQEHYARDRLAARLEELLMDVVREGAND
ncbi:MAG: glycosyltransferase family 4 protein [Anaerolineae bacterium]|nr:glycosyltransferase family 4 protein [Anaerolineae bacterium]